MEQGPLEFDVLDLEQQEIRIVLQAQDVLRFEGNNSLQEDPRSMPDPLVTFVDAARVGMLARTNVAPWLSGAEMLSRQIDREHRREVCRVRIWNLDQGAFLVLANMLLARNPERAEIATERIPEGATPSPLRLEDLRYPAPSGPLPFPVDYQQPDRTVRERYLQITFARSPTPKELETIYPGLDRWARLPLMGGYPADLMKPWQSTALAEPAFLLAPTTIEQAFPDLFFCDDDCYAAAINYAHVLDRSVCEVTGILLR